MAKKTLTEMSNEELLLKEKTVKTAIIVSRCLLIVLFLAGVFLMISKRGKFNVFIILPLTFFPILITNMNFLKEVRNEKMARNL